MSRRLKEYEIELRALALGLTSDWSLLACSNREFALAILRHAGCYGLGNR